MGGFDVVSMALLERGYDGMKTFFNCMARRFLYGWMQSSTWIDMFGCLLFLVYI